MGTDGTRPYRRLGRSQSGNTLQQFWRIEQSHGAHRHGDSTATAAGETVRKAVAAMPGWHPAVRVAAIM